MLDEWSISLGATNIKYVQGRLFSEMLGSIETAETD